MYNTNEQAKLSFEGHVLIKDVDTQEVLLDKFNAINFENMAIAIANLLANQTDDGDGYYIGKMAFGRGGTVIDANGNVSYRLPQVNGSQGALYEPLMGPNLEVFEKTQLDGSMSFEIEEASGQPYRDLTTVVVLDYNDPADALDSDNSVDFDNASDYVFDEIALVGDNGNFLTHLIFHPIQKSLNRKLEIRYTLRIRAGS